jgi:hypothetical protein
MKLSSRCSSVPTVLWAVRLESLDDEKNEADSGCVETILVGAWGDLANTRGQAGEGHCGACGGLSHGYPRGHV